MFPFIRGHGHAHGSRCSELTNYLGANPGGSPWNSTGKPLLLVDPNWILIDQLPGSFTPPLDSFQQSKSADWNPSLGGALAGKLQYNTILPPFLWETS